MIKELYSNPENNEFISGIQNIVLSDKMFYERLFSNRLSLNPESLNKIEQYLSLDYRIDSKVLPDYSFITNEVVRDQLIADYREMLRYRYGTRNHKIDFSEFCRYAVLQIEMLVNYYFETKYSSTELVVKEIQSASNKYTPKEQPKYVSEIPLLIKLTHLQLVFNWKNKITKYTYPIFVRNRQSHRSLIIDHDKIAEIEGKLKAAGAWYSSKWSEGPDFTISSLTGKAKAVDAVGQDALNEYNFQIWLDKQPFNEVMSSIKLLAENISSSLS